MQTIQNAAVHQRVVARQIHPFPVRMDFHARRIAEKLRRAHGINGIEVFGSVARNGFGNDLDLILTVSEEIWRDFRDTLLKDLDSESFVSDGEGMSAYRNARLRMDAAHWVLPTGWEFDVDVVLSLGRIDIFIFPTNWRDRLEELQGALPHTDPDFMKKIATDAIKL